MTTAPWTFEPRPDTRTTNIRLAIWLFLASEAMFFGSLFSAYVLLRAGSASWPETSTVLSAGDIALLTFFLALATRFVAKQPLAAVGSGGAFLAAKAVNYAILWNSGVRPATNLMVASWFVLSGLHWLHVAGGVGAVLWLRSTSRRISAAHRAERGHALRLYWYFVDLIWLIIALLFYFS